MSFWNQITVMLTIVVATLCATQMAVAEHHAKSGTFEFVQALNTDYTVVEQSGQTITAGSLKGSVTITKSSGGPFEEGSSQTQVAVVYIKKSSAGIDLMADAVQIDSDGDTRFVNGRRSIGDIAVGGGGRGSQEMTGGTGKYEGITGNCEYTVVYLPENRIVTRGTCEWQRN